MWSSPLEIFLLMRSRNNITILEAMKTSTWDGPSCVKRGAKYCHSSPIPSIHFAPRWVWNTLSNIWFLNTMGLYTDTSKLKWIFWTSHHRVLLIETLLKSSRNLSNGTNRRSVLQISKNQSMIKMVLTKNLLESRLIHRRVMEIRRRTLENGVISKQFPITTLMNVAHNSHWWLISKFEPSFRIQFRKYW